MVMIRGEQLYHDEILNYPCLKGFKLQTSRRKILKFLLFKTHFTDVGIAFVHVKEILSHINY